MVKLVAALSGLMMVNVAGAGLAQQPHPLNDVIWDVNAGVAVTEDELGAALLPYRYVLLGEKHDNPRHHDIQARLLAAIAQGERPPRVVFEMLDSASNTVIQAIAQGGFADDMAGLGKALRWEERGWPDFAMYAPVFEVAMAAKLPIVAGGPTREALKSVARGTPPEDAQGLRWERAYSDSQQADLVEELVVSHCQMVPPEHMAPMVAMQRLKDALMAKEMRAAERSGAVLIAGNGHVRKDRGVPHFLPLEGTRVVSPLEVREGKLRASDYLEVAKGLADYVWFTRAVASEDPCEQYKEQLQKLKEKAAKGHE
ncbi:ChaN family lipoprotein [Polycladidibacter hongkongensis]|uniref:ChaN family lipoprotein n=1 Tax=Polycladidibacter hongkongensis TaxID=1647556 RepID=UPI00082FE261|nr:ChaN family lipoprotein [Pseudovibrio hongkongensis]